MNEPVSRRQPLPAQWSVRAGRDAYLRENGFTVAAYDDKISRVKVFGLRILLPNTAKRRNAIKMHDLHHVATGFGTDLTGEAEVSAWELRRGIGGVGLYVRFLVTGLVAVGSLVAPRRTWGAWRRSGKRPSLFGRQGEYEHLLQMSIGELRRELDLPEAGLARGERGLHGDAPGA